MSVGSLQSEPGLLQSWRQEDEEHSDFDILLQVIDESWTRPKEIYRNYRLKAHDPVSKGTFYQHLKELEALGELESKGRSRSRRYRKTDAPVKDVLPDNSNSKNLDRLTRKIRAIAKQELRRSIENGDFNEVIKNQVRGFKTADVLKKTDREEESSEPLSDLEKKLIHILQGKDDWVKGTEIYQAYSETVENPLTKRSVRRHLNKLGEKSEIEIQGKTRNKRYRSV